MKSNILIVLCCLIFVILGCDKDSASNSKTPINGTWNVRNVSGGFAGIDDDYEEGVIIWTFDSQNSALVVENNNTSNTIYDGLASGHYSYSVLDLNKNQFLLVNNNELGGITILNSELVVDQNVMSNGTGADNFIIKLVK